MTFFNQVNLTRPTQVTYCSACNHEHVSDWDEGTPDTCERCGHIEGDELCMCMKCMKETEDDDDLTGLELKVIGFNCTEEDIYPKS